MFIQGGGQYCLLGCVDVIIFYGDLFMQGYFLMRYIIKNIYFFLEKYYFMELFGIEYIRQGFVCLIVRMKNGKGVSGLMILIGIVREIDFFFNCEGSEGIESYW